MPYGVHLLFDISHVDGITKTYSGRTVSLAIPRQYLAMVWRAYVQVCLLRNVEEPSVWL